MANEARPQGSILSPEIAKALMEHGRTYRRSEVIKALPMPGGFSVMRLGKLVSGSRGDFLFNDDKGFGVIYKADFESAGFVAGRGKKKKDSA